MNKQALRKAEKAFLRRYPGGFEHPEMVAIGKKHKMDQMIANANESFAKARFDDPAEIVGDMAKFVGRSSMVSMFEKPKFKGVVTSLGKKDQETLSGSLYELLHGKEKVGFEELVSQLRKHKLAKWTLATVFQSYYRPTKDVFIKPTTAKLIVDKLGLDLEYKAAPSWEFYRGFRKAIKEIKGEVGSNLAPDNAAFCGFLMTSLGDA